MKHIAAFFILCLLMGSFSKRLSGNDLQKFYALSTKVDQLSLSSGKQAHALLDEMYCMTHNHPDSSLLLIHCAYRQATLNYAQGEYDDSLTIAIQNYLQQMDERKYPIENALLYYAISLSYTTKGNYAEAFAFSLKTLEKMKTLQDSSLMAKTLNMLGNICSYIKIGGMATDYYHQAEQWTNSNDLIYYQIRNNYFRLLFFEHHLNSAIDSFLNIIPDIEALQEPGLLMLSYLNIGSCYSIEGDFKQSYHYYNMSKLLEQQVDNRRLTFSLYHNLGIYYYNIKDIPQSHQNFLLAKKIAEETDNMAQLSWAINNLAITFHELGQTDSAFLYLQEYQKLSAQLINNAKTIEAYQAYISVFMETSENKITIAEQEIKLKNRQFTFITILFIALLILIVMLLIVMLQQKRLRTADNKELSQRLEQEKKIQELQEEKHKDVIASKTREITSYSLQLSIKNNILKQISDLVKQLPEGNAIIDDVNKKIIDIVKSNINADSDWKNFKIHFENVHPSFFDRLKLFCDELTETNLRLCAYFRIGMSTKQIAHILNISPESVTIHRHRLKKKLGLLEEENLDDFIRSI